MNKTVRLYLPSIVLCTAFQSLFVECCFGQATEAASNQSATKVVDIPTRKGITQRLLVLEAKDSKEPKAAVVLLPGGHGGLQLTAEGKLTWGAGNFLVRSRQMFADQGFLTIVVDAPSDRQTAPFLTGFRTTPQHVADLKAVIAWVRKQTKVPVWLVGTSRGTESAAFAATQLPGAEGPDGIVLTSTILADPKETPVTAMALEKLRIPVLVVHHTQDGCSHCPFSDTAKLMQKLAGAPKKQLISISGGQTRGDPCEAWSYHGFNGVEQDAVNKISAWITAKS